MAEVEIPDPASTLSCGLPTWSADGKRILVERHVDPRWFPWLDELRAEIGAFAVALGLAVALWWLVRTLRCPRLPGRRYCRHCNHDVNAEADASADGTRCCTECGVVLTPRRVAVGRKLRWRLAAGFVPALALACVGLSRMHGLVVMQPIPHPTGQPVAWPVAALDAVRGWPLWRALRTTPSRLRIDVYEVTDAGDVARIGDARTNTPLGRGQWVASRDGRIFAWVQFDETNGWNREVHWWDVDTGTSRSAIVGGPGDAFICACGFTPDGRGIVVRKDRAVDGVANRANAGGRAPYQVDLLVVDVESGEVRRVAESEAFAIAASAPPVSGWSLEPGIGAVGDGPRIHWVTVSLQPSRGTRGARGRMYSQLVNVMVGGPDGVRHVELSHHELPEHLTLRAASIRSDRWLVLEGLIHGEHLHRDVRDMDLETGAVRVTAVSTPLAWEEPDGTVMTAQSAPKRRFAADVIARAPAGSAALVAHRARSSSDPPPDAILLRVWKR